jgi:hypothetical protein
LRAEACPPARPTTALHMSRHITGLCRSSTLRLSSFVFVCSLSSFVFRLRLFSALRRPSSVRCACRASRLSSYLAPRMLGFCGVL